MKKIIAVLLLIGASAAWAQQDIKLVELYTQDQLIKMINANTHLNRMVEDRCQLVQDVEAQAQTLKIPAYQFLFGDMLAWGVCVDKDVKRGLHYMELSAEQGLPAAMEQLGRYYATGTLVQTDKHKAVRFLREAGSLGNLSAQIRLAELFIDGYGSPYDYEDAYRWLHHSATADKDLHKKITGLLGELEKLMHPKAVRSAKRN